MIGSKFSLMEPSCLGLCSSELWSNPIGAISCLHPFAGPHIQCASFLRIPSRQRPRVRRWHLFVCRYGGIRRPCHCQPAFTSSTEVLPWRRRVSSNLVTATEQVFPTSCYQITAEASNCKPGLGSYTKFTGVFCHTFQFLQHHALTSTCQLRTNILNFS